MLSHLRRWLKIPEHHLWFSRLGVGPEDLHVFKKAFKLVLMFSPVWELPILSAGGWWLGLFWKWSWVQSKPGLCSWSPISLACCPLPPPASIGVLSIFEDLAHITSPLSNSPWSPDGKSSGGLGASQGILLSSSFVTYSGLSFMCLCPCGSLLCNGKASLVSPQGLHSVLNRVACFSLPGMSWQNTADWVA